MVQALSSRPVRRRTQHRRLPDFPIYQRLSALSTGGSGWQFRAAIEDSVQDSIFRATPPEGRRGKLRVSWAVALGLFTP